nr:variable surface lipoprotein [Mycoplasmopsis bovis]
MKKSKFLLLGSVASLASIPFVAAKCGETKEEKKPEEARQKTWRWRKPRLKTKTILGKIKHLGENTDQDKNPGGDKNPGTDKKPEEEKKPVAKITTRHLRKTKHWGWK